MIITKQWIMDNRTKGGAWTKAQLSAIGIDWPAPKGWIKRLEGSPISDDQQHKFESGADITAKMTKLASMNLEGRALSASQTMVLYIKALTDKRIKKVYLALREEVKRRKLEF